MNTLLDKDRMKFLVSWIEPAGLVRGQTSKNWEEAERLFNHLVDADSAVYVEIRRIGSVVKNKSSGRPVQ